MVTASIPSCFFYLPYCPNFTTCVLGHTAAHSFCSGLLCETYYSSLPSWQPLAITRLHLKERLDRKACNNCSYTYNFTLLDAPLQSIRSKTVLLFTMSTPNKPANRPTKATAAYGKGPGTKTVMVLDDIKSQMGSELLQDDNRYLVPSNDGKTPTFRAEFVFKVNLRKYMSLQRLVARENGKLSSMITFTSAGSDVDALAVPASKYVRDAWGRDGIKILQMVDNAMGGSRVPKFPTSKSNCVPNSSLTLTFGL